MRTRGISRGWTGRWTSCAKNGIFACIVTSTGAVPPWLATKYPEVLRTTFDGQRRKYGHRHNACPNSPVFRRLSTQLARKLAERYAAHPALVAWHVSNEYGGRCYCDNCEKAFRAWLQGAIRHAGRAEPRVVDRLLGPHVHRLGPDRRPQHPD